MQPISLFISHAWHASTASDLRKLMALLREASGFNFNNSSIISLTPRDLAEEDGQDPAEAAIERCEVFICFARPILETSDGLKHELQLALETEAPIIAVKPPDEAEFPAVVHRHPQIVLQSWDRDAIIAAICDLAGAETPAHLNAPATVNGFAHDEPDDEPADAADLWDTDDAEASEAAIGFSEPDVIDVAPLSAAEVSTLLDETEDPAPAALQTNPFKTPRKDDDAPTPAETIPLLSPPEPDVEPDVAVDGPPERAPATADFDTNLSNAPSPFFSAQTPDAPMIDASAETSAVVEEPSEADKPGDGPAVDEAPVEGFDPRYLAEIEKHRRPRPEKNRRERDAPSVWGPVKSFFANDPNRNS